MAFSVFGSVIAEICSRTPLASGRQVLWTVIANPKAGGFTIKSRWKKHAAMLDECVRRARENPLRKENGPSRTALREGGESGGLGLIPTRARRHAGQLTAALIEEAVAGGENGGGESAAGPFYLIITAGGDGTSLEVLSSLYHASEEVRRDFAVLRLPMGTANDGADSRDLDKALDLLISPAEIRRRRAVRLVTAGGKGKDSSLLAFNILSVGLDAFVTHMTNRMKGKLPGDSYKLWVDIAALFYDRIYKVDFMDIRSTDTEGREVKSFREKVLLVAVGESGRRCYGSQNWILPDARNICVMKQMPLLRKLALKDLFAHGKHVDKPEAILWNAARVEFSALHPLLAQMDGETVLLEESDYPAVIELTEPVIPVLKLNTSP